ncbi:BTB/POZ domain-containing protein 6-like [Mercenaria mercenaria]|uniref:BTB/POZ domain-containing protein 6-like n=1 Tax=Mercenaria mercenaria TaxID=6596 RepID=UPI00234F2844|nr:BTB/POZ domain-containing protein 6-like [Mercenaria mercenaria]XP_045177656.2 BTB/POZ domain-containing protein 6-like [Mercenaria mercenaria]
MAEILESLEDWQAGRSVVDCNKFMLQNEINCDVTFLLGQKKEAIKAHKYMLVSRSSVFQSIFCGSISGSSNNDTIPVSDIDTETFKTLLMFLYCEQAAVNAGNVKQLLYAAKKYAVKGLVDRCLTFLESSMNVQNVCNILEQVHLYDGKNLEAKCVNFIYEHAEDVLKSQAFTSLCPSCVEHIVKADELVVKERLVYEAVLSWADKECKRRHLEVTDENLRTMLGQTLFHVRFPLLDPVYFTNAISTRELLTMQEVIAVYQYFNGRAQPSNWKFCINRRRGFSISNVVRYNLISMEGFQRPKSGESDSIKFSCSEHILLHGASMYGSLDEAADYDVRIELWHCSEKENVQLASNFLTLSTTRTQHMYDVMLSAPVTLSPGKQYKISVEMKGPPTKMGYGGKSDITADGVNFHFMSLKGCKTTIGKGQIPGLLFTHTDVKQKN